MWVIADPCYFVFPAVEDVAHTEAYLLSDKSDMITGTAFAGWWVHTGDLVKSQECKRHNGLQCVEWFLNRMDNGV